MQFLKAYDLFMSQNDLAGMISSCIGIINSCLIERNDFNLLPRWTGELARLHQLANGTLTHELESELICSLTMSLTYHNPGHPDMQRWIGQARHLMESASDIELRLSIGGFVILYYSWIGASAEIRCVLDELGTSLDSSQSSAAALIQFQSVKAVSLWYFGLLKEAIECVASALALANTYDIHVFDSKLLAQGAYASLLSGKFGQAREFIANMAELTDFSQKARVCHYHLLAGWEAHGKGNILEAQGHVYSALELSRLINCPFASLVTRQLASQLYFASGESDIAFFLLTEARQVGQAMHSKVSEYVCNLIEAYFLLSHDPASKAGLDTLRAAFSIGRTSNIISHFAVQRNVLTFLCIKALENGIEQEQARRIIATFKLMPDPPPIELEQWPWPLKIYTLGRFGLIKDGVPLRFAGKVQHKPIEMLKALIAFGGRNVTEEKLCDLLWPNAAGDDAHKSFIVTLHRLRRLLGDDHFILNSEGLLALNQHCCWVDAWSFNRLAGQARTMLNGGSQDLSPAINANQKAISLYNGHFLAGDTDRQWSFSMRERLRGKMLHIVSATGLYWEEAGEWRKAVDCYLKGLETDDMVEENYQRLMVCHQHMGDRGAALSIYKRCCTALATAGIKPSSKTKYIYETLVYGS